MTDNANRADSDRSLSRRGRIPRPGPVFRLLHAAILVVGVFGSLWALQEGGWAVLALIATVPALILSGCCLLAARPAFRIAGIVAGALGVCGGLWLASVGLDLAVPGIGIACFYGYSLLAIQTGADARDASPAGRETGEPPVDAVNGVAARPLTMPPGLVLLVVFCVAKLVLLFANQGWWLGIREAIDLLGASGKENYPGPTIVLFLVRVSASLVLPPLAVYFCLRRKRPPLKLCLALMAGLPLFVMLASVPQYLLLFAGGKVLFFVRQLFFILVPAGFLYHLQTSRSVSAYFGEVPAKPRPASTRSPDAGNGPPTTGMTSPRKTGEAPTDGDTE